MIDVMSCSHTGIPDVAPPGDVIREKLKEMMPPDGWTQADLADVIGKDVTVVNRIINGRTGITARTACMLADAFGTTAEFWMHLGSAWKLAKCRPASNLLKAIRRRSKRMSKVKHEHA